MLDKLTAKGCKAIIGTDASVTVMDGPDVTLKVHEVIEFSTKKDEEGRPDTCRKDPFTLVLSGPLSMQVQDGIYDLTLHEIGLLEGVFIDNKSDTPESDTYNNEQKKDAISQFEKDAGDKAESDAAQEDASFTPSCRVLYDVVFT